MNLSLKNLTMAIVFFHLFMAIAEPSEIYLSKSIKPHMRDKLSKDLEKFEKLKFEPSHPELLKIMGIKELNAETALSWLNERVKFVVEENALSVVKMLLKKVIYVEKENVIFPNNEILPFAINPQEQVTNEESEGVTIMSNMGASLYLAGKEEQKIFGMKISQGLFRAPIKVSVDSPRVGIIQIGEGLFDRRMLVSTDQPDALANSIIRLVTFFHEARHSDGSGSSLAFAHSKCPPGHDFSGLHACDENLNGPYSIGAYINLEMIKACGSECSLREKEILKIDALDSFNRVLKKTNKKQIPTTYWNDKPERL